MTQEEYDNKREELVEHFIYGLNDDVVVNIHNEYCRTRGYKEDMIHYNTQEVFDKLMERRTPWQIADYVAYGGYSTADYYMWFDGSDLSSFDRPYEDRAPFDIRNLTVLTYQQLVRILNAVGVPHEDLDADLLYIKQQFQNAQNVK